jgi:protein-tyrosine-phosphatase/predicted ATP-grasp superfamily ATP-dependent carboligase
MIKPVLILGSEPRIAVTIARSLNLWGIPVYVATTSGRENRIVSASIEEFVCLPNVRNTPSDFINALIDLIRSKGIDMLIPATDSALVAVRDHYQELSSILHLSCPAPNVVERVLDKSITLKIAKQCGIATPIDYSAEDIIKLEALRNELRFPIIGKPRSKIEPGAFKIRYFRQFDDLRRAFGADIDFGKGILLQEYYSGEGVGVEVLMHRGEPITVFQHCRLKEYPSTGGVSVLAVSEPVNPDLERQAITLLCHLEWDGIAMVEFRRNKGTQNPVLMEVNGRYYGSLSLSVQAGIDFPYYEWQLAHNERPQPPATYLTGLRWRWTNGEVIRLHDLWAGSNGLPSRQSLYNELISFFHDLLPPTKDALWQWNDPLPQLLELYSSFKKLTVADVKQFVKKLIPNRIINQIRTSRGLGGEDRATYIKLQILRALGLRVNRLKEIPGHVLFVCHGNIIRSPMAAELLRQYLSDDSRPKISIASAGLHAKPERGADTRAIRVAKEFGISLDTHRVQEVTKGLIDQADVIFVMDFLNEAKLLTKYPYAKHKTLMLGAFGAKNNMNQIEIPDPYAGDIHSIRHCYQSIESNIRRVASRLCYVQKGA